MQDEAEVWSIEVEGWGSDVWGSVGGRVEGLEACEGGDLCGGGEQIRGDGVRV